MAYGRDGIRCFGGGLFLAAQFSIGENRGSSTDTYVGGFGVYQAVPLG